MSLSMLNRSIASMAGRAPGGSYDVQEYFWGAELSKDKPSFKWNPEIEEEFQDEMQNILFLKRAVLGIKAVEGERNIVEVQCKNMDNEDAKHPILSLTLGLQDHCDVELTFKQMEEVVFTLIEGSGPLHLVGQHYLETIREPEMDETDMDEEEEEEDLEAIEEEEEESVGKKRKMASPGKSPGKSKTNGADGPDSKKIKATKSAVAANGTTNGKTTKNKA